MDSPAPVPRLRPLARLARAALAAFAFILMLWAFGAIVHDGPLGRHNLALGLAWGAAWLAARILWRRRRWARVLWAGFFALVWLPWLTLRPSNDRDWSPEYAVEPHAELRGEEVVVHGVRNFAYHPDGTIAQARWESRTYHLDRLRGVDLFINYWGSEWMAHPLFSFDFGPDGHLAFSIETRREAGEAYMPLAGLYKTYELIYIAGDERDLVGIRSPIRGEQIFAYHLHSDPEKARRRFLEYLGRINRLHERPQFYDILRANCTTSIRSQTNAKERRPFSWRLILNGKMDELIFRRGGFEGAAGMDFADFRRRSFVDPAGLRPDSSTFSDDLRAGKPGFTPGH